MQLLNIAAYKFVALSGLAGLRKHLKDSCDQLGLKGTILLSPEGINLFLAGGEPAVRALQSMLGQFAELADLTYKESLSACQPFNKMLVKLKREIVPLGNENVSPVATPAPRLSPTALKAWLDAGRDVILLDVRNAFEVALGTFHGARHLSLKHFRGFPTAARLLPVDLQHKPIVTFCTGGIRCEKAAPVLMQQGFREVYQLHGGILKYFEDCGDAHFEGTCFVFDQRTALNAQLREAADNRSSAT